jgi:hypothetical protein
MTSLCSNKRCRAPISAVTAWVHAGALYCSPVCVHGDCPTCGVSLRSVPSFWVVAVAGRRELFCSARCGAASTEAERRAERDAVQAWARSRDLLTSLHALALLNAIAMTFFYTDDAVAEHVREHADVARGGRVDHERARRAWQRAWELDAAGGRTRALERTRKVVAIVRALARGAS